MVVEATLGSSSIRTPFSAPLVHVAHWTLNLKCGFSSSKWIDNLGSIDHPYLLIPLSQLILLLPDPVLLQLLLDLLFVLLNLVFPDVVLDELVHGLLI